MREEIDTIKWSEGANRQGLTKQLIFTKESISKYELLSSGAVVESQGTIVCGDLQLGDTWQALLRKFLDVTVTRDSSSCGAPNSPIESIKRHRIWRTGRV